MRWLVSRSLLTRLLPGGLLILTVVAGIRLVPDASWRQALEPMAFGVLGVGWLMAWRFRSSRIALALSLLALADSRFLVIPLRYLGSSEPWGQIWPWILAIDLAWLSLLEEVKVFSRRGGVRATFLVAQILLAAALAYSPAALEALLPAGAFLAWPAWLALSLAALSWLLRGGPVEAGLLWVIVLLVAGKGYLPPEVGGVLAGSILVIAVLEMAFMLAWRDELTGLPSRRALDAALDDLAGAYSVAMVDVDHFKRFNDRHGHDVGDQVLRRVASELARAGKAFRYGGEEFALIFPGWSAKETRPDLEELLEAVKERAFVLRGTARPKRRPKRKKSGSSRKLRVTVSIGVADNAKGRNPEQVLKAADKALYRAKRAGRNRVEGGATSRRVARRTAKS